MKRENNNGIEKSKICSKCNSLLGHANDSTMILSMAIDYLGKI